MPAHKTITDYVEKPVEIIHPWCVKNMNSWDQIRNYLHARLSQESYDNWFSGATYVSADNETLVVSVPDRETRTLLETEYAGLVNGAIRDLNLPFRRVNYDSAPLRVALTQVLAVMDSLETESGASALNPKFTFDSFVVGNCNQFAHAEGIERELGVQCAGARLRFQRVHHSQNLIQGAAQR